MSEITAERLDAERNGTFVPTDIQRTLEAALTKLAVETSRKGFSNAEADIAQLERSHLDARRRIDQAFQRNIAIAQARRENLLAYGNFQFVSIGEDCLSRTVLTQWGLKPSAKLGELSQPFDLAVHPLTTTIGLLESNFTGYLESENLEFSEKEQIVINSALNVQYNHEVGRLYAENNFAKLRETYSRRLHNFFSCFETSKILVFVLHIQRPSAYDMTRITKLFDLLNKNGRGRPFELIVVRTHAFGHVVFTEADQVSDTAIKVINCTYPFEGYVWHSPDHCFSQLGHQFEKILINKIKELLPAEVHG